MRYLTVSEVLQMYRSVMETSGGTFGILNLDALESSLDEQERIYSTLGIKE